MSVLPEDTRQHPTLDARQRQELHEYVAAVTCDFADIAAPSPLAACQLQRDVEAWVWGLELWGREALCCATIAALTEALQSWERTAKLIQSDDVLQAVDAGHVTSPTQLVELVEVWLTQPSEAAVLAADAALGEFDLDLMLPEMAYLHSSYFAWAVAAAHEAIPVTNHREPRAFAGRSVVYSIRAHACIEDRTDDAAAQEIAAAIRASVTQWFASA